MLIKTCSTKYEYIHSWYNDNMQRINARINKIYEADAEIVIYSIIAVQHGEVSLW